MIHRVSAHVAPPDLPEPPLLGFPPKFREWRPAQIHALDLVMGSTARVTGIVAPTGFGKSLFGVAAARLLDAQRAIYLTSTRSLQDQAEQDFGPVGLLDVRGQANYPCIALEPGSPLARYRNRRKHQPTCEEGPCRVGVPCHHAPDPRFPGQQPYCRYYGRVWEAQRRELISSNYAYWMSASAYGQGLGDFTFLILDEAHQAGEELERFLTFEIHPHDTVRIQSAMLGHDRTMVDWRMWGADQHGKVTDRLEYLGKTLPSTAEDAAERRRLQDVQSRLERLSTLDPKEWILQWDRRGVRFSPLDIRPYVERYLLQNVQRVLLMSATLTDKTLDLLGIPADQREVYEFPSTFPVERRPVFAFNATIEIRVDAKMTDQDKELWLDRIDTWIDSRRDRKGVIHCVSYERGEWLFQHSRHRDLMLWHERGDAQLGVEALKAHDGPAILISPSIMTGIDLPGDHCRWQIIAKVPLGDHRDPINQARTKADPEYPWYCAMQKLEQAVGRGMRSEEDWCETLIADDHFTQWFWRRAQHLATGSLREAVRFVTRCPAPLSVGSDTPVPI